MFHYKLKDKIAHQENNLVIARTFNIKKNEISIPLEGMCELYCTFQRKNILDQKIF